MLRFAVPFMLSNAMQVFYSLVDMVVVGKFVGSYGLSAVSVAGQVFTFMTMCALGFCTGGQVYIAQLIGAGERAALNRTIGTLFSLIGCIGVAVSALVLLFQESILALLNTPPEAFSMALDYMLVCGCGLIFTYGYNLVSAIMRGMGDSKHPFLFIMIASIINVVFDLLFVGVFGWGVAGAAVATIMGQGFSFLYALVYLYRRREAFGFDFKPASFVMDKAILASLCRLGVPFALQSCAINVSMLFVNSLVNGMGVYASATFGVGLKLDDIINKTTQGVSFAVSSMVGQNIAARELARTRRVVYCGWCMGAACYAIYTVFYLCFAKEMFGLFTDEAAVIALAPTFVSALVWSFPAMAMMRGTNGFVQGIGNARLSLLFSLIDGFVLRIALSYLLGTVLHMGLFGFFLGYGLAAYGTAVPGALYFLFGRWEERTLSVPSARAEG